MVGALLWRGMLVGVLAGVLSFGFLKAVGEPAVDKAIAFETQLDEAKARAETAKGMPAPAQEPELVSRATQAGIGLFTGVVVYSASFGGLFALAFAFAYGRIGDLDSRTTSAVLAGMGLVAIYLVPDLKYPANPPSVGDPETIAPRTALYFAMIAISLAGMVAAGMLRARLQPRYGAWNAALVSAGAYIVAMIIAGLALPTVNEVPEDFPAVVLWQFRVASLGAQLILWATLGIVFGMLTQRAATNRGGLRIGAV